MGMAGLKIVCGIYNVTTPELEPSFNSISQNTKAPQEGNGIIAGTTPPLTITSVQQKIIDQQTDRIIAPRIELGSLAAYRLPNQYISPDEAITAIEFKT